jgi:penicillin-binding protein 2
MSLGRRGRNGAAANGGMVPALRGLPDDVPRLIPRKRERRERRDPTNIRLGMLAFLGLALFAAMFTRLWFLQVLTDETFIAQAQQNQIDVVELPPARGRILDRNGVVLADNRYVSVVSVDQREWTDPEVQRPMVVAELAELLHMPPADVEAQLDDETQDPLLPKVIQDRVPEDVRILVEERNLPGVEGELRAVRSYPHGSVGAHLLGYTGLISEEELELAGPEYHLTDEIGKAGIEAVFDRELRGTAGERLLEVNRAREVVGQVGDDVAAEPGGDVRLTIDIRLQEAAEQAIEDQLAAARQRQSRDSGAYFPAPAGSAVVLDIRTGDVLALASYPSYDPNWLITGLTGAQYTERFLDEQVPSPLANRAVQGLYAPGSTFKLITALAGLRSGTLDPGEQYLDEGYFEIPDTDICDENNPNVVCKYFNARKEALGWLDLRVALTRSSDAYFYRQGYLLDRTGEGRGLQEMAADLGFGSVTGIQLPFESTGRVPSAALKQELADSGVFAEGNWLNGDNINFAVGQGFLTVTPLQLANAYATWANGGVRFNPSLVEQIEARTTGEVERSFEPRIADRIVLPPGTDVVRAGLAGVTTAGTAEFAFQGYDHGSFPVLGKTGTAQAEGRSKLTGRAREDTAAFAAVAPADNPRYAVVVVLEEAGFGGDAAAPAARAILEELASIEREDGIAAATAATELEEATPAVVECTRQAITTQYGSGTAIAELGLDGVARLLGCDPADLGPAPSLGMDLPEGVHAPPVTNELDAMVPERDP